MHIGKYESEEKEEIELCTRSTTSNIDLNSMFAIKMEKMKEKCVKVQENVAESELVNVMLERFKVNKFDKKLSGLERKVKQLEKKWSASK